MVPRWRFLATFLHPVFSASRLQQVSDLHLKFALSHTMCGSMADIQSVAAEVRLGKKEVEEEERTNGRMKIYWSALFHRPTIIMPLPVIMFMVLSSRQAFAKVHPIFCDECGLSTRWPPTLRPSQRTWALCPPNRLLPSTLMPKADTHFAISRRMKD